MATLQLLVERRDTQCLRRYWKLSGPKYRVLFAALRRLPRRTYLPHQGWVVNEEELALLQWVGLQVEEGHLTNEELARAEWVTQIFARDWLTAWQPFQPRLH
jgi:hypothetical protein